MTELDFNIDNKIVMEYYDEKCNKNRKKVLVRCPDCDKERFMRLDFWKKRKSDRCHSCSAKFYIKPPTTHGLSRTELYRKHKAIIDRCFNINNSSFHYYGGKGVSVADEWLNPSEGFLNFYKWAVLHGFKSGLQIDRIDSDGDYTPDNCRFITAQENVSRVKNLFGYEGRQVKQWKGIPVKNVA